MVTVSRVLKKASDLFVECCPLPQRRDLLSDLQAAQPEPVQKQPRPRMDPTVPLRGLLRPLREVRQSKKRISDGKLDDKTSRLTGENCNSFTLKN